MIATELPPFLQGLLVSLISLCVGSFLNVVIVRLPRGRSIMQPSSRCGFCRSAIPWWSNIPLVSFLATAGQCVKCGSAYSARYAVIELLTGLLGLALWSVYGFSLQLLLIGIFSAGFIAISFIDLEFRLIPDSLSLGGLAVALCLSLFAPPIFPTPWIESVMAALIGMGGFWVLSRGYAFLMGEEGLGGGDVKLMGLIGALLGFRGVLISVLVGSVAGSIVGLGSMLWFKKTRRFPIPFGPFLLLGAFVVIFGLDRFLSSLLMGEF